MATNPDALRAVYVTININEDPTAQARYTWRKVEADVVVEIPNPDQAKIVAWLESHDFVQHGAFVGYRDPKLAVFWLRRCLHPKLLEQADSPDKLAQVIGEYVIPVTCNWSPQTGRMTTTRTANQIRRHRRRAGPDDKRDLQYIEKPTQEQTLRAYGLIK